MKSIGKLSSALKCNKCNKCSVTSLTFSCTAKITYNSEVQSMVGLPAPETRIGGDQVDVSLGQVTTVRTAATWKRSTEQHEAVTFQPTSSRPSPVPAAVADPEWRSRTRLPVTRMPMPVTGMSVTRMLVQPTLSAPGPVARKAASVII